MTTAAVDTENETSVVVMLDCLTLLIENEQLVDAAVVSVDSVPAALGHILVVWHLVDEIERSIDIESEGFIQALGWSFTLSVDVDDAPSLVCAIVSSVRDDPLGFKILATVYIEYLLVVNIHDVLPVVLEDVPPEDIG